MNCLRLHLHLLKSILVVQFIVTIVEPSEHTLGNHLYENIDKVFREGELFNKVSNTPKNYTIRYKYWKKEVGGGISYTRFNILGAQKSSPSDIDYTSVFSNMMTYADRYVSATINVINATNLTSTVEIRGLYGNNFDVYGNTYNVIKSRSYAFICTESAKIRSHRKHVIEYGQRVPDDFVVRFQYANSNEGKLNLDFHDPNIKINYILVAVDSPWAVVFRNKIITTAERLQAMIYALDHNDFHALIMICGIQIK